MLSNSETRALYDRYGHAGLRSGGFTPTHFDMGGLSDLFAAFFGDDLFGGGARGAAHSAAPTSRAEIEIELVDAARGTTVEVPFEVAVTVHDLRRRRRRARHAAADLSALRRAAVGCSRCRAASSASSSARTACPDCRGRGQIVEHPCKECDGAGRTLESRELDVDVPAGIHDGQRIRVSGEGHAGALGGRAGDVYVLVHVSPDPRFVREGNDIYSQVDLTIVQAALGATVAGRDARRAGRARASPPACSRARCASCAARACRCCRASAAATSACS